MRQAEKKSTFCVKDEKFRGGEIRTPDFFVPNEARYLAALHPEFLNYFVFLHVLVNKIIYIPGQKHAFCPFSIVYLIRVRGWCYFVQTCYFSYQYCSRCS